MKSVMSQFFLCDHGDPKPKVDFQQSDHSLCQVFLGRLQTQVEWVVDLEERKEYIGKHFNDSDKENIILKKQHFCGLKSLFSIGAYLSDGIISTDYGASMSHEEYHKMTYPVSRVVITSS